MNRRKQQQQEVDKCMDSIHVLLCLYSEDGFGVWLGLRNGLGWVELSLSKTSSHDRTINAIVGNNSGYYGRVFTHESLQKFLLDLVRQEYRISQDPTTSVFLSD